MSIKKNESNIENKIKKNIMPITITTNINPNNYVFVNKKSQISSLYLKMGEKMKSKRLKNTKSCSNFQNSEDSSKNDISNNSLKLSNFSMLKNLKTNSNLSEYNEMWGYATNKIQNYEQKIPDKQNYLIHVNLNRNHTSSISNFILNKKNRKAKFSKNKNIISLNNSELYNSLNCLSSRNKFYPKNGEKSSDLKKIKNNMKTKKFKFHFNERKKNKYISTSFCNLNITKNINLNQTLQKSENKIIYNNSSKNKIVSRISKERKIQHSRFNTMFIDEKDINEKFIKKNNILKQKIILNKNLIKHNNSVLSINNKEKIQKFNDSLFKIKNNQNLNLNFHIKNSLSTNGNNNYINENNLLSKEKNGIKKKDKINNNNNKNKNKKNINPIIERKVKINRKDLLQEIRNKIDIKKKIENNNKPKKTEKNKIKEFSKIIVLDEYKTKKPSFNFYNNKLNQNSKTSNIERFNKTKRDGIKNKNNLILNNSKSKENLEIEKIKSFKSKKNKNNSIINGNIDKNILIKNINNDKSIKEFNIIDFSNGPDIRSFPFQLMNQKKTNYKKPLIKITTHSNISFNKNNLDKEPLSSSAINNSQIMTINQNNILIKDKNLIIKKKKIGNNSFHINKRLICYSSRETNNNNIEIKNSLFDNENLEELPQNYDEKFNDLYAVVHKINFGSVLIGAESLFSSDSQKYKEFQYNFDLAFIKKYNKPNMEENKGKNLKKTNNSCSTKTDFSSSNKNFYKNIYNNSVIPNEFEISELV